MVANEQNTRKKAGNVEDRKRQFYGDLDLTNLNYLDHRDAARIAKDLDVLQNLVSQVRTFKVKNSVIMAALLKKGGERRKALQDAAA